MECNGCGLNADCRNEHYDKCPFDGKKPQHNIQIDMPYIDFLLRIEKALRNNIVVWEDEEYRDIAERITKELYE